MSGKLGFTVPSARDSSPPRMAQKHPAKSPESGDSAAGRAAPPAVGPAGVPLPAPHPAARPAHVLRRRSLHAAPQLLTPVSPAACTPGGQAASVLRVASRPPPGARILEERARAQAARRGAFAVSTQPEVRGTKREAPGIPGMNSWERGWRETEALATAVVGSGRSTAAARGRGGSRPSARKTQLGRCSPQARRRALRP